MILDSLANCETYFSLNRSFELVFEFIKNNDLHTLEPGKQAVSEDVFVISEKVQAKPEAEALLEAHREYIDVQLCISGIDRMGWCALENCGPVKESHEDRDLYFYEGVPETFCTVGAGEFAVFFPGDAHAPNVGSGELHKVIFKVRV